VRLTTAATAIAALTLAASLAACSPAEDLKAAEPTNPSTAAETAKTSAPTTANEDTGGDTDPAAGEPTSGKDLAVAETAFGRDDDTWWYAVVVDNPNKDAVFETASIDVEALDKSGTILDSDSHFQTLLSGKTVLVGKFFDVGTAKIAKLNVRGPDGSEAIDADADDTGTLKVGGVKHRSDGFEVKVNGTVTSTFASDQELVNVAVLARNPAGKIIAAETGYIDRLPAGGKAQFEVDFFNDKLPKTTKYEAHASL
jgi:hypothetical protein